MYGIPAGTDVFMVPVETYAGGGFMDVKKYKTRKLKVFGVEEMIIDPTGIHKRASGPREKTVGGRWAANGWYGFALSDQWSYPKGKPGAKWYAVLIARTNIEVDGHPSFSVERSAS